MGACHSGMTAETKRSRNLDLRLAVEKDDATHVIKLLLLGAGESGKSTIFKQFRVLYGKPFTEGERRMCLAAMQRATITTMKALLQRPEADLIPTLLPERTLLNSITEDTPYDERIGKAISALWYSDEGVKLAFSGKRGIVPPTATTTTTAAPLTAVTASSSSSSSSSAATIAATSSSLSAASTALAVTSSSSSSDTSSTAAAARALSDNTTYLLEKCITISAKGYTPTVDDILRVRQRTTAVAEEAFWVDHAFFHIVDVGGQKNERKKWITSFDAVTAVVFVASLADFDQQMEEDPTTNRLVDSLGLFAEVVNSRWFERSSIILFLNKRDVFEAKIKYINIDLRHDGDSESGIPARFQDFNGARGDVVEALRYITGRFLELAPHHRPIYHHVTCATDTKSVKVVIKACKDHIVKENLRHSDLEE